MAEPAEHKLLKHDWPPHPNEYWYMKFESPTALDYMIDHFTEQVGREPEFILLPDERWWLDSGQYGPESLFFIYRNVKISWHPENLLLVAVGPKGKREKA